MVESKPIPIPIPLSSTDSQTPQPSHSDAFALSTSPPPLPPNSDPRLSLRPSSPEAEPPNLSSSHSSNAKDDTIPGVEGGPSLSAYRAAEGKAERLDRLRSLFDSIPHPSSSEISFQEADPVMTSTSSAEASTSALTLEGGMSVEEVKREENRKLYARELWKKCSGSTHTNERIVDGSSKPFPATTDSKPLSTSNSTSNPKPEEKAQTARRWTAFSLYAEEKEKELWKLFVELDRDGDMRLGKEEVREACRRAGVTVKENVLDGFVRDLSKGGHGIGFDEWRDFLLLLPRPTSISEIFKYYQTHRLQRPSMSRLTQDGDVVVGGGKTGWNKLLGKQGVVEHQLNHPHHHRALSTSSTTSTSSGTTSLASPPLPSSSSEMPISSTSTSTSSIPTPPPINIRKLEEGNPSSDERKWATEVALQAKDNSGKAGNVESTTEELREVDEEEEEEEEECHEGATHGMFAGAGKFLLAGGVAGAVSRTATAPFDRLKVYLITSPSTFQPSHSLQEGTKQPRRNAGSIPAAVRALWRQGGGLSAFWTGNGLNVVKIFPESAIKFLSYESAKRVFAEYWDDVPDQTLISNSSRFVAGGIGGVVSQFVIYPIETLKTRVMSSTGGKLHGNALISRTAIEMWRTGGIRLYFKGLTAGLIGVFPYSAIDMSTFEGIKLAYKKWAGEEPGIAGSLGFGALSGGIGATSVYPLNLIRTRLQAQGTPAHPQRYLGVRDAATRCYRLEGWRGFYKGLTPTLVKVVPAVALSYAVYDASKKVLFGTEDPDFHEGHDHDAEES